MNEIVAVLLEIEAAQFLIVSFLFIMLLFKNMGGRE